MVRLWCIATVLLAAVAWSAWCPPAMALTFTSSLSGTTSPVFPTEGTGRGNWNTAYAQGFSAALNNNVNTGLTPSIIPANRPTVTLSQMTFYRSGLNTNYPIDANQPTGGGPLATPTNVQVAIVSNIFSDLTTFTTTSPFVLGLSTNTIASIHVNTDAENQSANPSFGEALTFNFNNIPIQYGHGSWDPVTGVPYNDGFSLTPESPAYAAIFVTNNGGTLSLVKVPTIIVNYGANNGPPLHDYGNVSADYNNGVSNYFHTGGGTYLDSFNDIHADADFIATFSTPVIHGDINGDGHFTMADVVAMEQALANVNTLNGVPTTVGDFNSDGKVTNADLQGMLTALKNGQGQQSAVPEPSCLALASIAGVALVLMGRRGGRRGVSERP